jgi:RHS repeat-associated protein
MTYVYAAKSNQLSSIAANGATDAIGYDNAGNINSFNPAPAGGITGTTYNQAGRLASVRAGNNMAAQYTYDGFGHRLMRVGAITSTTLYQYDSRGRLIEETDGDGNALVDYIYVGSMPVATISSGQVYFLLDDRLGTPQLATDINQNVVWAANYGPFGEMSSVPSGIIQNLRLPGQEYDAETGLYHNGFRDYVPEWGRYLETDPIGLAGGLNTYGYVNANPLAAADPLGLCELIDQLEEQAKGVLEWLGENLQEKLLEPASEAFNAFAQYGSEAEAGLILAAQEAVTGPIGAFQAAYSATHAAIEDLRLAYPGWFAFYFPTSVEQFSLAVNMETAQPALQRAIQMQSQPIGTLQGGVNSPFVIVPPKPVAPPAPAPAH